MKPSEKVGLYFTKYKLRAYNTFRFKTGLPAYHGYLTLKRISTSIVIGNIGEKDLKTQIFRLSPFDLAKLKELLKDFDSRLLAWKTTEDLEKEKRI